MSKYRIRHCEGNKAAWCLIALDDDGTEIDSYGGYTTSYSLDSLFDECPPPNPQAWGYRGVCAVMVCPYDLALITWAVASPLAALALRGLLGFLQAYD